MGRWTEDRTVSKDRPHTPYLTAQVIRGLNRALNVALMFRDELSDADIADIECARGWLQHACDRTRRKIT